MRRAVLILAVNLLLICTAAGQAVRQKTAPKAKAPRTSKASSKKEHAAEATGGARPKWDFYASLSTVFDSNIEHDLNGLRSFGLVPALGVSYRNERSRNIFSMDYEIAGHSYTHTNRWDVVSHNLSLSYRRALPHHFSSETGADLSIRGSSEDRELNNQYSLSERLGYRFKRLNRFVAYAVYRWKRRSEDPDSDGVSPYIGGKYERTLGERRAWEIGYRYEMNRAQGPRQRYIRSTYNTAFTTSLGVRDELTLGAKHKRQLYERLVKVDGVRVPRHDSRWDFAASWTHTISPSLAITLDYEFEKRSSNDPDKRFNAHFLSLTFRYDWRR